jgi:uncharacterized membrane protein YbhN (UPF0104 family)
MNIKRILVATIKVLLILLIVYFLFDQIASHWQEIRDYSWRIDYGLLSLSVVLGLLSFVIMAANWRSLINGFGYRIPVARSFRIFYLSDLGRYIPGRIWQLFGILYLTKREGIPPEQATASFVLIQLFAIPASFVLFVLAVQLEPRILVEQVAMLGKGSAWIMAAVMVATIAFLVIWPDRIVRLVNVLLRRLNRPEVSFRLDKKVALELLLGYACGWFVYGLAFFAFLKAIVPGVAIGVVAAVGIFNAAYQIGYLALFAPGGFGPRELVLGFMLTPFTGPIAPAVAVVARLWSILIEVIAALIALAIRK